MLNRQEYESWFLPTLLSDEAYRDLIRAMLDEIVELQKYNMGTFDAVGFNGVPEDINFTNSNDWYLCQSFNPYKGIYDLVQDAFVVTSPELIYTKQASPRFAIMNFPFFVGETYNVKFTVYDITSFTGNTTIDFGIGQLSQQSALIELATTELTIDLELSAYDHWFYIGVATGGASFKIKDLIITGVENSANAGVRWSNLKRILDIDNAGRFVLERMRDSLTFPSIANTPEELLKQLLKDYNTFIGLKGTELMSVIFFYFLGYAVEFVYLYATKGDYEAIDSSYTQQKEDDTLLSVGVAAETRLATKVILMEDGHQIIPGDLLSNDTIAFPNVYVTVTKVEDNLVYVDASVDVYATNGFDVYRKYLYPVNPDPDNLFKTSHIDVYFIEKYIEGTGIDFSTLQQDFERYLPINVVIRFFGFTTDIDPESFRIIEPLFTFSITESASFSIGETTQMPADDFVYLPVRQSPQTHLDINSKPVDATSLAYIGYAVGGDPIYAGYYN